MAGHVVTLYLREAGFKVDTLSGTHAFDKSTYLINLAEPKKFKDFLTKRHYDAIINCAGILVKQSEERKDLAIIINSYLPHFLEHYYANSNTKIVHLSSDCVFSGKEAPYKEDSLYTGQDFYDRTKALGEINNNKDLTFRLSIIGPDLKKTGEGLFNWFYSQKGEIFGYNRVIWSGVTTVELARAIKAALEQKLTGLYHLVPKQNISKYALLELLKEVFNRKDITIKPDNRHVLDRTLINTRRDFEFTVSDYKKMLTEMQDWIYAHPKLYPHYR